MELDITEFTMTECPKDFQASICEIGNIASRHTWQAALECDTMFVTDANRQEFIDHFEGYGAWSEEEMNGWSNVELNALVIQEISGWMRDFSDDPISEWDWDDYRAQSEAGRISGRLFRADDNRVYCYFGM